MGIHHISLSSAPLQPPPLAPNPVPLSLPLFPPLGRASTDDRSSRTTQGRAESKGTPTHMHSSRQHGSRAAFCKACRSWGRGGRRRAARPRSSASIRRNDSATCQQAMPSPCPRFLVSSLHSPFLPPLPPLLMQGSCTFVPLPFFFFLYFPVSPLPIPYIYISMENPRPPRPEADTGTGRKGRKSHAR